MPTLFGIAMAISAYAVSLPLLLWMVPVILGLLLCIPIGMLSSKCFNPNARLFRTPEQTSPPNVLIRANELENATDEPIACPLRELCNDPRLLDAHLMNLPGDRRRNRGQVNPHLAIARAKIEDAETFDEALGYLTSREQFAVLGSLAMLRGSVRHAAGRSRALVIPPRVPKPGAGKLLLSRHLGLVRMHASLLRQNEKTPDYKGCSPSRAVSKI